MHLSEEDHQNVTAAAAIAAGLRRRQTAIAPLIALLSRGNPRERAISCRALGWIGSPVAAPAVRAVLNDPEWRVRLAATKALADLQAGYAYIEIYNLRADPSPRVRQAAGSTLRRLARSSRQVLS